MTPERWKKVEPIYQAALDRDVAARPAFLAEACAGDVELRREVESLLEAHRPQDRFLESGALNAVARELAMDSPRATAGQRLGAYELIELLGAGGMGEVWRALDPGLRRHVAIKILPSQYSLDPDRLRRFEQEARAAGRLNHPNVLSVYAIGQHDGAPFLVTELLEGATLRQKLAGGALPEARALEYADQLVQGLAAAHDKGIVHRDLKPENVFITSDGRVKILDFGLAKLASTSPQQELPTQTATGMALGTPAYMAPEQIRGQPVDHRADVFAFGALLYEMMAGRRPFVGETSAETMTAILRQEPPPLAGVSAQVEQIVRHCLEKEPAARYQSARDLGFQLRLGRHPSTPIAALPMAGRRRRALVASLVGLIVLAATATLTWWLTRPGPPASTPTFRRLTSDSGLSTDPALSLDGRLIAYASDRAGAGNLDIWLQPLATAEAIRLTTDSADESEPTFSPDGSRIAFRSERDGGGIYTVSVFGGEPRLIAKQGRRPQFSPDGAEIAYWVSTSAVPYIGKVFAVPTVGDAPTPIAPTFASARYPLWSPDGKSLLVVGARDEKDVGAGHDWWIVARNGDSAVKTGAIDVFARQEIRARVQASTIPPSHWDGDHVVFSATSQDSTNLWRVPLPIQTGRVAGQAVRLTLGTSIETKPSVIPGGRIAFASLKQDVNIWSLPIAADGIRVAGELQQVTSAAFDAHTSLSADAKKLVFISTRAGNADVWIKDLVSGAEKALTATPAHKEQPEITADGTRVAYLVFENSRWVIHEIATSGGVPQRLCQDCGRPWDWSPDGRKLLYLIPEGVRQPGLVVGMVDVATRDKAVYLEHPNYSLARARFSPDGRWVSFTAIGPANMRIVIAPVQDHGAPREDQWITIAEETPVVDKSQWSPDGNLLYFISEADGYRCIRARRLEPATKRPVGPPLDIYHSHNARRSLMNPWLGLLEISVSPDKLFFNLGETTGNTWMLEWKP
jgi:serine/threonine protein kinase/dipeptidyl aminopeptidase/acylaminoacyl peptidase